MTLTVSHYTVELNHCHSSIREIHSFLSSNFPKCSPSMNLIAPSAIVFVVVVVVVAIIVILDVVRSSPPGVIIFISSFIIIAPFDCQRQVGPESGGPTPPQPNRYPRRGNTNSFIGVLGLRGGLSSSFGWKWNQWTGSNGFLRLQKSSKIGQTDRQTAKRRYLVATAP